MDEIVRINHFCDLEKRKTCSNYAPNLSFDLNVKKDVKNSSNRGIWET